MTIGDRIFERLKQLNMTQKEFSENAGIKESTISEWKKRKTNPTVDKIMDICNVLLMQFPSHPQFLFLLEAVQE